MAAKKPASKIRSIVYWSFTILLSLQIATGAVLDLTLNKNFVDIATHLGYPGYLLIILGVLRVAALIIILMPGAALMKEWAYAGVFLEFAIAFISHIVVGDGMSQWISAVVFALVAIVSWSLRPPSRKLNALATVPVS